MHPENELYPERLLDDALFDPVGCVVEMAHIIALELGFGAGLFHDGEDPLLVIERILGLRNHTTYWEIDPVLPEFLDGLLVEWRISNYDVSISYNISKNNEPVSIEVNGSPLVSSSLSNNYRSPGIRIQSDDLFGHLHKGANSIRISSSSIQQPL